MSFMRFGSAPATEAHYIRVLRTKMAEDQLLEQERSDMLNERENRRIRAAENRTRLMHSTQRMKQLDSKRLDLRDVS